MVGATPREQLDNLKLDFLLRLMGKATPRPEAVHLVLQPVAAAYSENVRRLQHQVNLPAYAAAFALRFEHHRCLAIQEVKGSLVPVEHTDTDRAAINQKFSQILNESNRELNKRIRQAGDDWLSPTVLQELSEGLHVLNQLAATMGAMRIGAPEMLASYITAMWTIFETLAGDLWEAAINGHPSGLSGLHGKKIHSSGAQTEEKTIPLSQIERYGYDLTSNMGTILREKFNFNSLNGIREAYSMAFHKDTSKVDASLSDKSLDALSVVRNLITHKRAIVDQRYSERAKDLPLAPKGQIGERILLDGEIMTALVSAGLDRCNDLIFAVDDWLQRHLRQRRSPARR